MSTRFWLILGTIDAPWCTWRELTEALGDVSEALEAAQTLGWVEDLAIDHDGVSVAVVTLARIIGLRPPITQRSRNDIYIPSPTTKNGWNHPSR